MTRDEIHQKYNRIASQLAPDDLAAMHARLDRVLRAFEPACELCEGSGIATVISRKTAKKITIACPNHCEPCSLDIPNPIEVSQSAPWVPWRQN